MKISKSQSILVVAVIALFCFIYFGMSTIPKEQKAAIMSRATNIEATGIQNIVASAKKALSKDQLNIIEALQTEYHDAKSDDDKIERAKSMASKWYEFEVPIVSGYFAEEIAKKKNTKEAWSIAGTTYQIGMKSSNEEKEVLFAKGRAVKAFENAISLSDNNINDKINLALIYVDNPDTSPMQGIQMLLKLNENNPENVQVMNQLARLALRTNQTKKAVQRLEKALSLEPENNNSICLIAQAYAQAGNESKSKEFQDKCKK
jgi:tetratricopeptide (TPR) repeat protein